MGADSRKTGPADSPGDTGASVSGGDTGPRRDEGTPATDAASAERSRAQVEERQVSPDWQAIAVRTAEDTGPRRDEGTPATDAASAERSRAQVEERQVTPDLQAIATETGGSLLGLEHNIKSQDSLERKIAQSDEAPTDVLRYTMAFSHEHIADGAAAAMASLRANGYEIASVENKWLDPSPGEYRGIHATVESGTGYRFELQFHTPESFAVKEAGTHDLYEIARDENQPHADRDGAELASRLYSSTLLVPPPGIERIAQS